MKRCFLIFTCLAFFTNSYSQIFFQDFNRGTSLSSYIGSGDQQFLTISSYRNSLAKIEDQQLTFTKTGESSSFFVAQYTEVTATKLTFDVDINPTEPIALNESHRGVLVLGGGVDGAWAEVSPKLPHNDHIHTRVMFNVSYGDGNVPQYSFANSKIQFTGKKRVTIVSNNTGSILKYKGGNNTENTVKDRGYDLWVDDVLVMNDATAVGQKATLEYLKFVYPPKAPNCKLIFDNFQVEDLSGGTKPETKVNVQNKETDPNVLWSWQFTFPAESKGREIAFPATYTKKGLDKAILSRGLNAAPGSGSVRGFTADFPIDGNIEHAKKSGSYFEFVLNIGKGIRVKLESIDVTLRRQQESPYIYRWAYSLDGKNYVDIGNKDTEITSIENLGVEQPTLDLTQLSDLQSVRGKVYFRLYVWGGMSMSGSQRSFGFGKSDTQGSEVIVFKGKVY